MKSRTCTLLAITLLLVSAGSGGAAELDVSALPTQVESLPVTEGDVLKLDLIGAHQLALARNLNLHVGRYDLAVANANVRGSGGIFDPTLWANLGFDSTNQPTSTVLEGANVAESKNARFGLGFNQLLPSGTEIGASWTSFRGETNSQFFFLNPRWDANLNLTLTQPLLNGFGTVANRAQIIIAENLRDQTAVGFEVQVIQLLADVELAYWELVATREAIAVTEQSLALAETLLEETAQRVEVGTSAPIDMVQSEATVATRVQELIYANNAASNAEDNLKALLGFDLPHEWTVQIETTDSYNTDPLLPDSDADRIPDGVELRLWMDPTAHDTFIDYDLDGQVSGVEVRAGTHPLLFDEEDALVEQVRYRVEEGEPLGGGASCYEWAFEGLTLVPSLSLSGDIEDKGLNRILFFAEEEPMGLAGSRGRFHVACVEARYLGEAYKVPADGRIEDLSRYRFVEIQDFDPDTHCLELDADPTERPEWSWDDP